MGPGRGVWEGGVLGGPLPAVNSVEPDFYAVQL